MKMENKKLSKEEKKKISKRTSNLIKNSKKINFINKT